MRKLLVIAGPLSGYSVALYRAVQATWPCSVDVIHEPLPSSTGFAHESVSFDDFRALDWTKATIAELLGFLRQARADAVIVHGTRPVRATGIALAITPRRMPVLFVSDANVCELASQRSKLLPRLAAYSALFARVDVALSLGLTNELALRLLGAKRVETVPTYAIDFGALDEARARAPAPSPDPRKSITIVARMVEAKNLAVAIEALSSDPAIRDHVRVSLVGDGPLRSELQSLATARKLPCEFLGALPRAEVGAVVGHSDALLLPSVSEPWGIVVCEALGLGIPVIATPAVGAAVSLAGYSRGVLLSASPSEVDLANVLRTFLTNAEELKAAAISSATFVRRRFSLPAVTSSLVTLLQELVARSGASP
jgi:glycosyltransferase involved in cell wall biosynthesis